MKIKSTAKHVIQYKKRKADITLLQLLLRDVQLTQFIVASSAVKSSNVGVAPC